MNKLSVNADTDKTDVPLRFEEVVYKNRYNDAITVTEAEASKLLSICFVVSGSGVHQVFNKSIPCQKGHICVIRPNVAHAFFVADDSDELVVRQIQISAKDWFSENFFNKEKPSYCYGVFSEKSHVAYATLNAQTEERMTFLFDCIESEIKEQGKYWTEIVRGCIAGILVQTNRYMNYAIKAKKSSSFKEWGVALDMVAAIEENYSDCRFSLNSLSDMLYTSKSQLSKAFRRATGVNFSDYLRDIRINCVCELLQKSDDSIADIAKKSGFNNMASFYKIFEAVKSVTPSEYRKTKKHLCDTLGEHNKIKGEKIMSIMNEISENLQRGKSKVVKELVQQALDEGVAPAEILEQGLLAGMSVIGEKFKNNEVYVPEVLVAARAMNMGTQILKPHLAAEGVQSVGKVCIGTVQGDLHDIGKNLVKMMMEGKGLEVIDLGTDVAPEAFVQAAIEHNCQVICCSALLTTTMGVMDAVVKAAEEAGIRDKVKIMIGGAPVSQEYCDSIGADCYTVDAASAAEAALSFCK